MMKNILFDILLIAETIFTFYLLRILQGYDDSAVYTLRVIVPSFVISVIGALIVSKKHKEIDKYELTRFGILSSLSIADITFFITLTLILLSI